MTRCMFATVSLLPSVLRFVVNDLFAVDCFTCKRKATQRPPRKPPPRPRPEKQTGSESNSHRASNQSYLTPFIYFNSCFSKLIRAWLLKLNTKARGRPLRLAFLIAAPGHWRPRPPGRQRHAGGARRPGGIKGAGLNQHAPIDVQVLEALLPFSDMAYTEVGRLPAANRPRYAHHSAVVCD